MDALLGGARARGEGGNDTVLGGNGYDKVYTNAGHDVLIGGAGTDQLFGGKDQLDARNNAGRVGTAPDNPS